ncbi:hypothetical protein D3C75_837340 [compost metagenome]
MRDVGDKFLPRPVRPLQLPAHEHEVGGQLADFIAPCGIELDIVSALGDLLGRLRQPGDRLHNMKDSDQDKPQAEQNRSRNQHGKKDPQLAKLYLGIRTHKQRVGLAVKVYGNTYRIAELIVKKAGNEHLAGKIRYTMVDAAGQHFLQHTLLQVIFAERQAIEPFITLVV